jgi:hypothetical protein
MGCETFEIAPRQVDMLRFCILMVFICPTRGKKERLQHYEYTEKFRISTLVQGKSQRFPSFPVLVLASAAKRVKALPPTLAFPVVRVVRKPQRAAFTASGSEKA